MADQATARPRSVALLGGGVIGGGWAARFLLNGVDVRLFDPDREAARRVDAMLHNARRAYRRLTLAPLPAEGELTLVDSPEEAIAGVDFVQESAPEREGVKRARAGGGVPGGRPRRGVRLVDVRPAPVAAAGRHGPPRAPGGRASVQPGLPAPPGRGVRRRANLAGDPRAGRGRLPLRRDAAARPAQGGGGLRGRPAAGGAVARGALARQRRRGDRRGDRRRHPLRRGPALVVHGHLPDLSHRGRRGRHAPLHGGSSDRPCVFRGPSSWTCPS